ncbi:histone H1A, sperm-like [Hylaeus anthracinus]|uniref:histone H1A, sperm-like n=1 Tax=Hylaeus anthracinus TaxID=313031 RepID=UPI0023B8F05C|nr:histone H1A, sperm-like [Hylaeus anthracinus]XP_054009948.1 histone H1A, sperm-like [Hylaeus anthracinus]
MESKGDSGGTVVEAVKDSIVSVKKIGKSKAKMQRPKVSHPPTSEMVKAAIKQLKDRKGSSLQAIKKYISAAYKIDGGKMSPFIKRYLKAALTSGAVLQSKGKGASGSFKLPINGSESKSENRAIKSVARQSTSKIATSPKKVSVGAKKPAALKKNVTSVSAIKMKTKTKQISKIRKPAKALVVKTRTPKPKKTISTRARKIPAK